MWVGVRVSTQKTKFCNSLICGLVSISLVHSLTHPLVHSPTSSDLPLTLFSKKVVGNTHTYIHIQIEREKMEIDSGPDLEFAQQTQNSLSWFCALPGATFHPNIRLTDLRESGGGRGISCVSPPFLPFSSSLFTSTPIPLHKLPPFW